MCRWGWLLASENLTADAVNLGHADHGVKYGDLQVVGMVLVESVGRRGVSAMFTLCNL